MTMSAAFQHHAGSSRKFVGVLAVATMLVIAASAWRPLMVVDWLLENLLVAVLLAGLAMTYRRARLSDGS